jgi:glycosyltransferase involved in cell wall biosynthesis
MHIVHVGKYYSPYRGGIESVVEQLCRGLVERGEQATAVVCNDGPTTVEDTLHGVRVIRLGTRLLLNSQPFTLRLAATLRALKFDLLHFHTPNPVGAMAILAVRTAKPIVATHHSDIVRQRILGAPAMGVQAMLYRKATAIVAATPKHIEHSSVLRRFGDKCRVIHFAIDASPYANAPDAWDDALPMEWEADPLILFVGRLVYYKGVNVLLDALTSIQGAHLAIVGEGPLETQLQAQTHALGLTDRVAFLGGVTEARLRTLYKRCRFLVLPSVAASEAFGMVQLEAMAAGRPVISTALKSGVPYVNQHGRTGLVVPPSDPSALGAAMRLLLADPSYAAQLGLTAQQRVLNEFNVQGVVDAHLALYRQVV